MTRAEREAQKAYIDAVVALRVAQAIALIDKESLRGPPGRDGLDGKDGKDGRDAVDGKDGTDGKDGVGIKGDPGADGKDGRDGIDGKDGQEGKKGGRGEKGDAGRDGRDGKDGRDGCSTKDEVLLVVHDAIDAAIPELRHELKEFQVSELEKYPVYRFCGVFQEGKEYSPGNWVTWAGSGWHCNQVTRTKPGDGNPAWTLVIKKGRDGKDLTR